ncbi:MAG: cytochrome c biogenesis CcdA family protein, partial [Gemmatimonadota bacterium]
MSGVGHLMLSGPLLLAVPVAAAAGAVTFLSPCVLPLVPGYLSYVTGMAGVGAQQPGPAAAAAGGVPASVGAAAAAPAVSGTAGAGAAPAGGAVGTAVRAAAPAAAGRRRQRRTVAGAALFVLGFSLVFASEGVAFGGLGSLLRSHTAGLTQILGGLTIVLGLLFAGVFDRFPVTGRIARPSFRPRAGLAGAPVLGAFFGLTWSPCIGPTLTVVMSLAFTSGTAVRGALLMFAYGLGLGIPFLAVALLFQRGVTALAFARRHVRTITRVGGGLLVAVGVLEVTGVWTAALAWLQSHWVSGYQSPL